MRDGHCYFITLCHHFFPTTTELSQYFRDNFHSKAKVTDFKNLKDFSRFFVIPSHQLRTSLRLLGFIHYTLLLPDMILLMRVCLQRTRIAETIRLLLAS